MSELPPEPPPEDENPDPLAGIDPELIAELNAKSREIVAELVADGKLGALFEHDKVWPAPHNPMAVTRRLLQDFNHDRLSTLLHWRGGWMEWQHTHWAEVEESAIRKALYHKLEHAVYLVNQKSAKGKAKAKPEEEPATLDDLLGDVAAPWAPNRRKIGDVMEALKACVHVRESVDTPSWLPGAPMRNGSNLWPAGETVSCTNGLLHVRTRELAPLTPGFFTQVGVPFNYLPDASAPVKWLEFLQELWPNDPDSIAALQEFFGYVLSGRTDLQKILLMIGPPRSGRGTIARILTALIGRANVANPTLASLGQNFGLQPLIGKPLAIVGDVRLGKDSTSTVVERLLSISGEDGLTCDRKFKEPWTGKLPTRFLLISNELPKFGDASGAIATRFIVLELVQSFLGKEISTLTEQLLTELPGILLWALDGLDEISRHSFTRVTSSEDSIRQMQDLVSPISAFVRDTCERAPDYDVEAKALYGAWTDWCEINGHRRTSSPVFGRDLRSVMPGLRTFQPHGQSRRYVGIRLKTLSRTAHSGEISVSGVSPVSNHPENGQRETGETGETHDSPLWPVHSDALDKGHRQCDSCGEPLPASAIADGSTTHPTCDQGATP